ncbi:hypothetical protein B0H13DRAFT_2447578 [Mycena leptocephala]|nr:hypothetical protein B0H13DRAFT_2447578 [Mycena leptocephala]
MSFTVYSTPDPQTQFSTESFRNLTVAEADESHKKLPYILPKNSVAKWVFDREVPTTISEIIVATGEAVPCLQDMLQITQTMDFAFSHHGARSVCLQLPGGVVHYHLSKIRLIMNINNERYNLHLASSLLARVVSSSLLLPDIIEDFKGNKFAKPLAGFFGADTPLYSLGCLLDECWAVEDVLNARAELTYFHRAVTKEFGEDPSFMFLPTFFLNDCRKLIKEPNRRKRAPFHRMDERALFRSYQAAIVDLEHGDSLHLPAPPDLLLLLRWAFAGLPGFEPPPSQTHITPGLIDRQTTLGGPGSCGIASTNFIEFRVGLGNPRWMADQSAQFRDLYLQDLVLYHLIARRKMTMYQDWVTPCTLVSNGEVPGFLPDLGIGYNDFNLDMPASNLEHPIFDWVVARANQPRIFSEATTCSASVARDSASLPSSAPSISVRPPANPVPPITQLAEVNLDHNFDFSTFDFDGISSTTI